MNTPSTTSSPSSSSTRPAPLTPGPSGLDGARLSPTSMALITCGVVGNVLFIATYLIAGATRPGYNPWEQAISALSLGPGGWVQQVNFMVFGLLTCASAFGWRLALKDGVGAVSYPVLKGVIGVGLIVSGLFSQDPAVGYPVGVVVGPPTLHGAIHNVAGVVAILAIAFSAIVLGVRFAVERRWRVWAPFALAVGVVSLVLIFVYGALVGQPGTPAGLVQRFATGLEPILSLAVLGRLVADRRQLVSQPQH